MISHASGHMGVVNSLALAMAHVDENTPEIPGGVIARYPGTKEPTGYLEETAIMVAAGALKGVEANEEDLLAEVQEVYISNGVTTVQDGGTSGAGLAMMRHAGQAGRLKVDIVTYPVRWRVCVQKGWMRCWRTIRTLWVSTKIM